mgnify:FL=1
MKKVMVSGCFDLLHAGHIEFLKSASSYGNVHVFIGSDSNIKKLKNHEASFNQNERLFILQSIKYVYKAEISSGEGYLDFSENLKKLKPDFFIVNEDGDRDEKRELCKKYNVEYIVLSREPSEGLPARSSTQLKESKSLPYRLCLAGGWMDQPFVNSIQPGSVVTIQIKPDDNFIKRGGLATSTRETWKNLIKFNPKAKNSSELAKLLFRYENPPGKKYISGSQDAIGLTHPGINKLDFDCSFWPNKIETCLDEDICRWLEKHLLLVPIGERPNRYDPLMEQNINRQSVQKLSMAGMNCYNSILRKDLNGLGKSLTDTHDAWREILPLTTNKEIDNILNSYDNYCAGRTTSGCGGGYVILATNHEIENSIKIKIIR